jgi:hypothetical protein
MIDKSIQYFEEGGAAVDDWQPPAAMDQKAYDAYQKLVDQGSDPFAARALLTAVGLLPYDKRYDLQGRGTVTANDALQFQKYAEGAKTEYDDAIKKTYEGYRIPPEMLDRGVVGGPAILPPGDRIPREIFNRPVEGGPAILPPGDRLPREIFNRPVEGGPAILPPGGGELMPIPPGGDFGLPPLPPGGPVQPSPPVVAPPPVYGGPVQPRPPVVAPPPVYGGPVQPSPPVNPPPVYGGPVQPSPPVNPPPVYGGPVQPSPPFYQPPAITTPAAGETRSQGYNATLDRFANSPFARPQGIESLRLGGLEL